MDVEFLGHACFALYGDGQTMIVDPYEAGQFAGRMAYRPIDVVADWVVCSHQHVDHCATHALPGSPTIIESGAAGPFVVTRIPLAHDEYDGRRRGGHVDALRIDVAGRSLLHLSDVGESPRAEVVEAHRGVDVLLVPTGGYYTIGAAQAWEWIERIAPGTAIPIHYGTSACTLPIRGVDVFAAWSDDPVVWNSHRFHVHKTAGDRLIVPPRLT